MMEPYVRVQKVNLGSKWQDQIRLFQGWAHLAGNKWSPLNLMMKRTKLMKKTSLELVHTLQLPMNTSQKWNQCSPYGSDFFSEAKSTDELANELDKELQAIEISDETIEERNELSSRIVSNEI